MPTFSTADGSPAALSPAEQQEALSLAEQQQPAAQTILPMGRQPQFTDPTTGQPAQMTPDEQKQARQSAGVVDPLQDMSPEEMAELAHKAPQAFTPLAAFLARPDLQTNPDVINRVASAHRLFKDTTGALEGVTPGSVASSVAGFFKGLGKWGLSALDVPLGTFLPDAKLDPQGLAEKRATQQKLAEAASGTAVAATGLANQIGGVLRSLRNKAISVSEAHRGGATEGQFQTPSQLLSQEEKTQEFLSDVAHAKQLQRIAAGHAGDPVLHNLAAGGDWETTIANLEKEGYGVRPEETAKYAAGDPITAAAFGEAFGAAAKLGGAVLPAEAIQAGLKAAGNQAARVVGGALQKTGTVIDVTGKGLEKAAPLVGTVAGVGKGIADLYTGNFIEAGKALALGPLGGKGIGEAGSLARKIAPTLKKFGEQVASGENITSATAQGVRDALQVTPAAIAELAKGVATDLGIAATGETPEEKSGVGLGTVFGGLGAAGKFVPHAVSGQIVGARDWGSDTVIQSNGYFPALDAVHAQGYANAPQGIRRRVNSVRAVLKAVNPNADFIYAPKPAEGVEDQLPQQLVAQGVNPDTAALWAAQDGLTSHELPNGKTLVLARDIGAAPHEAVGHGLENVLGEGIMRQIDQVVQNDPTYQNNWDAIASNYAARLGWDGTGRWQDFLLDKTGWGNNYAKEKAVFQSQPIGPHAAGQAEAVYDLAGNDWRKVLTPEEQNEAADSYISREIFAENADALFKRTGPSLQQTGLPYKIAKVVAAFTQALGAEPLAGRRSEGLGIPLSSQVIEAAQQGGQARLAQQPPVAPKLKISKPGTPIPVTPEQQQNAVDEARQAAAASPTAPVEGGTQSPREILGAIAEAIASRTGVKLNYLSAPDEPAAAISSNRKVRRALIEVGRTLPAAARALWEKNFFPERVLQNKDGSFQVSGWAPEVFAANVHRTAQQLNGLGHADLVPYPVDPKTGSLTPQGWTDLYEDSQKAVRNYTSGRTASGEDLVLPESVVAAGASKPPVRGTAEPLDQNKADFISAMFGLKLPQTPRISLGDLRLPTAIVGEDISRATLPGRVEPPVVPRGSFEGKKAQALGIEGREIMEVNPWRNRAEAAGFDSKNLIEARQNLNAGSIKEVAATPEQPQFRGNTLTIQAGFMPKREIQIEGPDGKKYRATFDGLQDFSAIGRGKIPQITPLEDLPGATPAKSTTYGPSLEAKGYKLPTDLTAEPTDVLAGRVPIPNDKTGQFIPQKEADLVDPEFKKWFTGSRVITESGAPQQVFHSSTSGKISEFDIKKSQDGGIWFGDNPDSTENFINWSNERGGSVYRPPGEIGTTPAYLSIKNPKRYEDTYNDYVQARNRAENKPGGLFGELQRQGYDGVIIGDKNHTWLDDEKFPAVGQQFVVFDPNQIRLAKKLQRPPSLESVRARQEAEYQAQEAAREAMGQGHDVYGRTSSGKFEPVSDTDAISNYTKFKIKKAQFLPSDHPHAVAHAAVLDEDTGKIYTGPTHIHATLAYLEERNPGNEDNLFNAAKTNMAGSENLVDGFVTNSGEFLDRAQALQRAKDLGQYKAKPGQRTLESQSFDRQQELRKAGYSPETTAQFSPEQPKTFIVRHGSTEMNSSDPDKDLIRGHINVPLDDKGRKEAQDTAQKIADAGGVDHIISSDLGRTVETANAIADKTGATIETDPGLRPWKFGPTIEGKPTSKMLPRIKELTENPDQRPPGGETFNEFKDRFLDAFHRAQQNNLDKNTAIVTHYRGTKLLDAWRKTGVDNDTIDKGVFEDYDKSKTPGSVDVVDKTGAKFSSSKESAQFAPQKVTDEELKKRPYLDLYWTDLPGMVHPDLQSEANRGLPPSVTIERLKKAGFDSIDIQENGSFHDYDNNPQFRKDGKGEFPLTAEGLKAASDKAAKMWDETDKAAWQDLYGDAQYMPSAKVKTTQLRHYTTADDLEKVSPEFHGTGLAGAESARKKDYPELWVPRSYFGTPGYEKEPGLGNVRYKAEVRSGNLYDFSEDPKGLYPSSKELEAAGYASMDNRAAVSMYEKRIRDAGYEGYINKDAKAVAKFTDTPVKKMRPLQSEQVQLMPGGDPRAIRAAAIRDPETGEITEGPMHFYARQSYQKDHPDFDPMNFFTFEEGFTDNGGKFLSRTQAFERAKEMQQLREVKGETQEAAEQAYDKMGQLASERTKMAQFKPSLTAPEPEEFKDIRTLPAALAKPNWAILTATKESLGSGTDEVNKLANENLEKALIADGYSPVPVKGNYKGVDQGQNFLVTGMTPAEAQKWGAQYGQESVLTPDGLLYQDGKVNPVEPTEHYFGDEAKKQDFYSQIEGGPAFSMGVDFSQKLTPEEARKAFEVRGPVAAGKVNPLTGPRDRQRAPEEVQSLSLEHVLANPDMAKFAAKVVEKIKTIPGFKNISDKNIPKALAEMADRLAANIRFMHDRATPENKALWRTWYDLAHKMTKEWGPEYGYHPDVIAAVNARLSPQTDWYNNVTLTRAVLDTFKKNPEFTEDDRNFLKAKIELGEEGDGEEKTLKEWQIRRKNEMLDELAGIKDGQKMSELNDLQAGMLMRAHNENTRSLLTHDHNLKLTGDYTGWGKPFDDLRSVVSILRNPTQENVNRELGNNHKVRSFYNNHVAPQSPDWTTVDTHAVAAATLMPYGSKDQQVKDAFGAPKHKASGYNGTYFLYQHAYEKVAKELGLLPRELQSIVWEQIRQDLTPEGKRSLIAQDSESIKKVHRQIDDGKLTPAEGRQRIMDIFREASGHPAEQLELPASQLEVRPK